MRALVTNDDGIGSEGIAVLARAARACGLDVLVAAPSWDASGSSASVTAVEASGGVVYRDVRRRGLDAPAVAVEAAPAFIVRAAIGGTFGPPPDLVLSGVNHGLNTGEAIVHSGTVGAALTAATFRTPAAAFSMDVVPPDLHWETAAFVARAVVRWLIGLDRPAVLNVNVPNVPGEALRGLRRARLSPVGSVQTTVTEVGGGRHPLETADAVPPPADDGTDLGVVRAGAAALTPIRAVTEDAELRTDDLTGSRHVDD